TLNDHLPAGVVAGQLPPLLPGRAQHETKIVNLIVVLTLLDELAVVLGAGHPVLAQSKLIEQPHLAAQEALAPVGPGFLAMLPATLVGVEREIVGIVLSQTQHLARGELEGGAGGRLCRLAEGQGAAFANSTGGPVHRSPTSLLADPADPGRSLGAGTHDHALVFDVLIDRRAAEFPANARGAIAAE